MYEAYLKDEKRPKDLILMLRLSVTIEPLAMTNGVRWCGHMLSQMVDHVLVRALELRIKVKRRIRGRERLVGGRMMKKTIRLY